MTRRDSDERLRDESPAYRPDDDWDVLEPQGMQVIVSVRFDAPTARRIGELARHAGRTPSALIREWTHQRLTAIEATGGAGQQSAIGEARTAYEAHELGADLESLRQRYRPHRVDVLLVGESRPAGGTFFYAANSNLFYATRAAFMAALGPVPPGERFLEYLKNRGVWLSDIADQPVDRMVGRPRRDAVRSRVAHLTKLLTQERPRLVVAIKRDLGAPVREAMREAGLPPSRLHVLPFPLYQWRAEYVAGLARLLGTESTPMASGDDPEAVSASEKGRGRSLPPATALLSELVDRPLHTLTGRPNRILRIDRDRVIVATKRSPQGQPVPISDVQAALDKLAQDGELEIDVPTAGHRSAFIGAVLQTLPGAEAGVRPRRIRLREDS